MSTATTHSTAVSQGSSAPHRLPLLCTSFCKVKEIRLADANVIMAQAHKDGAFNLSRIPRFSRRSSTADVIDLATDSSYREQNSSTPVTVRRQNSINSRDARKYGSPYLHATAERPGLVKRRQTFDHLPSEDSISRRRKASFGSDGYCSSSTTPVATDRYSMPSPRHQRMPSSDPGATLRENFVRYTPQIKTNPVFDPGRVQVFVRIRPLTEEEDAREEEVALSPEGSDMAQLRMFDGKNDRTYQFDGILPMQSTNKEVFTSVGQPLVFSALSGFNGILMCYGQTGTGKTYTLMSPDGMSVRVVYKCFNIINQDKRHKYTVTCSYLQIYQEKIYDLLNTTRTVNLSLRQHPKDGVYVENLTEYVVHSPKEVLNLLRIGRRRLVFAETQMNRASSRSHAICQLKIFKEKAKDKDMRVDMSRAESASGWNTPQTDAYMDDEMDSDSDIYSDYNNIHSTLMNDEQEDGDCLSQLTELDDSVTSVKGKIYLCDLAGSERIKRTKAQGERLQEAQHINSSLLELGNVIQALAEGNRGHVPFRNSTLTRLLQEGLSGNCKTKLVVCVAPTIKDAHETKCSLNFGSRAMKVQVTARVNYEVDYKKLAECLASKLESMEEEWNMKRADLESVISILRAELAARRPTSSVDGYMFPAQNGVHGDSPVRKHAQALLVLELMTLQMFYSFQSGQQQALTRDSDLNFARMFMNDNKNLVIESMEKLSELLVDCLRGSVIASGALTSNHSTSSLIGSPDYIESDSVFTDGVPSALEPLSHYLASIKRDASLKQTGKDSRGYPEKVTCLVNQLSKLKKTIALAAVGFLKNLVIVGEESSSFNSVEQLLAMVDDPNDLLFESDHDESQKQQLEHALYFLLMDKALMACIVLLQSQASGGGGGGVADDDMMLRLAAEKVERERLNEELVQARLDRVQSEGRVKHLEQELGSVAETKAIVEEKLARISQENTVLETKIKKYHSDKRELEKKIAEIESRRSQLEQSMRTTENNNAKKERAIVDLKNQKVALDSIMTTLKEELSVLEKEKAKEHDERRLLEVELEEVKDRNIILETEWSCCKEENGLLETELTALEDDKAMLEEELSKYKDDVQMLEEALTVLEKQACSYKADVQILKQKEEKLIASIRVEKEKFARDLTAMKQEMASLKGEKRKFQRDISLSRADKSNTERAYAALKGQNDGLKSELGGIKQTERKLLKEITLLRNDKIKLEREVTSLKAENTKLRTDLVTADNLKTEMKLLQKNEEKLTQIFKGEQEKLANELADSKRKFSEMEGNLKTMEDEKERLVEQLRHYEKAASSLNDTWKLAESMHPQLEKNDGDDSHKTGVHGNLSRKSVNAGHVSEVEGKILDLQRRLAFFMTEKDEIQKELSESREKNDQLLKELKNLESDTSNIQALLAKLSDEKTSLEGKLKACEDNQTIMAKERNRLELEMSRTSEQKNSLQGRLDYALEANHVLEVDKITLQKSVAKLSAESCVFSVENRHFRQQLVRSRDEVKGLNSELSSLSDELSQVRVRLEHANEQRRSVDNKLKAKCQENSQLRRELENYKEDELELGTQLAELSAKFKLVDRNLNHLVVEKNTILSDAALEKMDARHHAETQQRTNMRLQQEVADLQNTVVTLKENLSNLTTEREQMEAAFKETIAMAESDAASDGLLSGSKSTLLRFVSELRVELDYLQEQKDSLTVKLETLEGEMGEVRTANDQLTSELALHTTRHDQEKTDHQTHIDQLYRQLEHALKDKRTLEGEMDFIKQQNAELRAEIAIILEENDKLEVEIDDLEQDYERQETELETSAEETKQLLRQLCSVETKNLQLSTVQSNMQDEAERLSDVNSRLENERSSVEDERTTFRDRMIVAELEVSRLKSECDTLTRQRNVLITELKYARRNRDAVSNELHDLARALSPLKAEVLTAVNRNAVSSQTDEDTCDSAIASASCARDSNASLTYEDTNSEEPTMLNNDQSIELRLTQIKNEKANLEKQVLTIISSLDCTENAEIGCESVVAFKELLVGFSAVERECVILQDELNDISTGNEVLRIEVDSLKSELMSAQENMTLSIMERLKLTNQMRQFSKELKDTRSSSDLSSSVGIKALYAEIVQLRGLAGDVEFAGSSALETIQRVSSQLETVEQNLNRIEEFKGVLEANLRQYEQRNINLESQLRLVYADLEEMNKHCNGGSMPKGTLIMMQAASLHEHAAKMEHDLTSAERENEQLTETSKDLAERCGELANEQGICSEAQLYLQECVDSQQRRIERLEEEAEMMASDREKLRKKVGVFREDKKRIIEDFSRLNKSLSAYARYNTELERRLESFKEDMGKLAETAVEIKQEKKTMRHRNGIHRSSDEDNPNMLCERCRLKLQRKFSGLDRNSQTLGTELFDCIEDNLAVETAILSFMDQRARLEREMYQVDADRRNLEDIMADVRLISDRGLSTSQSLIDADWNGKMSGDQQGAWSSGLLSSRRKSMTSRSGDSFVGDFEDSTSTPLRSHTALGICQSSSSSLSLNHISDRVAVKSFHSMGSSDVSTEPLQVNSLSCSPQFDNAAGDLLTDENRFKNPSSQTQSTCCPLEEHKLVDEAGLSHHRTHKSRHFSGFLKKFRSSKRKRSFDGDCTSTL